MRVRKIKLNKYSTSDFLSKLLYFEIIKKEFEYDFNKFKYYAGHSLGEYSALACAGSISFEDTLKSYKKEEVHASCSKWKAMLAVLGMASKELDKILNENIKKYECFIANDNSKHQVVGGLKKTLIYCQMI